MKKSLRNTAAMALLGFGIVTILPSQAIAYSCNAQFERASELISKAEKLVKKDTDSRILAMIAEAKGIAQAGIISHKAANENHTGHDGKYMHGDAVRKGKWAQDLAKQALFLLTGDV